MRLPVAEEDAAWARMDLPLTPREVRGFLANIEVFLRINPCIEFESLLLMPGGFLRILGRNDSNNQDFDAAARFVTDANRMDLVLRYESGIKRETRFAVARCPHGSVLAITEVYDTPPGDECKRRFGGRSQPCALGCRASQASSAPGTLAMDPRVQMVHAIVLARNASAPATIGSPDRLDNAAGVRGVPCRPGGLCGQLAVPAMA